MPDPERQRTGRLGGLTSWEYTTDREARLAPVRRKSPASDSYHAERLGLDLIWTTRYAAPTAVLMHPRRWAWLSQLDEQNRPLFLPDANKPMNAAGIQENVEPQRRWAGSWASQSIRQPEHHGRQRNAFWD